MPTENATPTLVDSELVSVDASVNVAELMSGSEDNQISITATAFFGSHTFVGSGSEIENEVITIAPRHVSTVFTGNGNIGLPGLTTVLL